MKKMQSSVPVPEALALVLYDASTDNRIKGIKQQSLPASSPPSVPAVSAKCLSFSSRNCFSHALLVERNTLIVGAAAQQQLRL